jgi:hypothetical protein
MLAILSQTCGLERMGDHRSFVSDSYSVQLQRPISWDAFEALAKSCGSSLHKFSVRIGKRQSASATIFNDFTALRTLSWKCQSGFINAPPDGFPNLEELWIS